MRKINFRQIYADPSNVPLLQFDQSESKKNRQDAPSRAPAPNPTPPTPARLSRHPLSQACGDLPTAAREALTKQVEQSGSVRTIPTLNNQVLLDWELYNIAADLGLEVRTEAFQGPDPVAFVVLHHLRQPHWDRGQRAVITVRLYNTWREPGRPAKPVLNTDLSQSQDEPNLTPEDPATTEEMAEAAQVSPTFITRAKRVHELGQAEAVISGNLKFAKAYQRVRLVTDAGLAEAVTRGEQAFDDVHSRAQVIADAGLLKRVKAKELDPDEAYEMARAGETGEREPERTRPPNKAELAKRVAELEAENRKLRTGNSEHADAVVRHQQQVSSLQSDLAHAEARAAAAEAEVNRLTALLPSTDMAA